MLIWYITGAGAAVAIAWLAAMLHLSGHAPLGLLSLGVGAALGAALNTLAAMLRVAGRSTTVVSTVIFALVTVLAQHAWLYVDFRRQWHEARAASPEVALFRPESPWSPAEYLTRELTPGRAALWALDAALVVAAAVAVVVWWQRRSK
jgi:ABC-type uncharacterized transport system permease subunit